MESLQFLMDGFGIALQPGNLVYALIGCMIGSLVGVLPGIGPTAAVAILIPVTFVLDPIGAIIMLSAIYYGGMYGGTITSVLVNTPGEAASAITCLDGHEMAKRGRAGAALSIAAIGSFIGGTFSTMALVLVALPLTRLAVKFGPPELFSLLVVGLSLVTGLAGSSMIKALLSAILGLLIGMVGIDPSLGAPRFAFGRPELLDGIGIVPIAVGMFGVGEILINLEGRATPVIHSRLSSLWLTAKEARDSVAPIARGTILGFLLGIIPGVGGIVPTFISYVLERKLSRTPDKFGTGMIEGVAGPETANNSYVNASLIPLFTLGIPTSPTIAILMGAFMMNGLLPGPTLFMEHPDVAWAVIASFYVGNAMLVVLNLPLVPLWVSLLRIPRSTLYAMILLFCAVGSYSVKNSVFDVGLTFAFGVLGYVFKKTDFPMAPLVLTVIIGPMLERALRTSLEMSAGDFSIFLTSPVSAAFLVIAAIVLVTSAFTTVVSFARRKQEEVV